MGSTLRTFRGLSCAASNVQRFVAPTRLSRQHLLPSISATATSQRGFHATRPKMVVHNIRSPEEFKEAIAKNEYVLVDCFATWCGPCKAIAPLVTEMSNKPEFENLHFTKFDVDDLPELATEYGVRAMPTFLFFKKGEKKHEFIGADPRELLGSLIDFAADKY